MKKDIGSIFTLDKNAFEQQTSTTINDKKRIYFSLCREALVVIAKRHYNSNRIVILPAFTCSTVIKPFEQNNWKCIFYDINKDLRINTESFLYLLSKFSPAIAVIHPFFGASLNDIEIDLLKKAKENGCVTVLDNTQCVFADNEIDYVDYCIASSRKWINCPDGGYLEFLNEDISENIETYPINTVFVEQMAYSMYLRHLYFSSDNDLLKTISINLNKQAIKNISIPYSIHRMSDISFSILSQCNKDEIIKKRLDNYKYLYNHLQQSNVVLPRRNINEVNCGPLYFPIFAEDRKACQKTLAQNNIYAPILWTLYKEELLISNDVKYLYEHMLAIPCDQRYDKKDMDEIINMFR